MDKKQLNNEIILCRPAVRKAKVAVIRKIIRKMKILKSCKVEDMKEKKLQKAERMFEKVQIMKKVKLDEVTKFALRNNDLETFLKGPTLDLKQKALACLAKHDAIVKKVNSIKERIPYWETELPLMLDTLGKKKIKKPDRKKESVTTPSESGLEKFRVSENRNVKGSESGPREKPEKRSETAFKTRRKHNRKSEGSEDGTTEELPVASEAAKKIEKIDDPFFIEKKVVAPKLILESLDRIGDNKTDKVGKTFFKSKTFDSGSGGKRFKSKKDSSKFSAREPPTLVEEEKLHPSWVAKRVKLIKPFQGKKIKFSDD